MYDQASIEKHSREDESKLLCNAVAKKAIPTNGKLFRFKEIKTTYDPCMRRNKETF